YRPVSIFVSFLIRRISSTKEERARKKEEDARQKEQKERERRHLEASPIEAPKSNPFFDEPISHPNEAELSSPTEFPSRVERYHEEIPSPIPEDKPHEPSKITPSTPIIQNVGISEASIDISDEELREMGFDPSTMKVEAAPKEPTPQPTVYKAPETHYENSSSIETPQTPSSVQKIISEPAKEEVHPETPLHEDPLPLFEDRIEEKKAEPVSSRIAPEPAPSRVEPLRAEPNPIIQEKRVIAPEPIAEDDLPDIQPDDEVAEPIKPYEFPPLDLLFNPVDESSKMEARRQECDNRCVLINKALHDLKAGAHVVSYTIGPSVTRYDVQTDPDVSVSSLSKYIKDISVRLGGVSTRFEEIVKGAMTSGLEIANTSTTTVTIKEMIAHLPEGKKYSMYVPFGKSISGDYIEGDLSEFPHMLIAGTTGSGKSIFVHSLLMALIMRNRPDELKLLVVDPKRVEMGKYRDLPHLLCPIVKSATEAKVAFKKLVDEMERRYALFEEAGVSKIRQYNDDYAEEAGVKKLPFIVAVVDEYADLVDVCKDIGDLIVRIAQKARAAGIHLVIATQRPEVKIVTGVIKSNLPCRVALSMNSPTDSMTILNQGGAENLVGHGDMLVDCSQVDRSGFIRCQGAYVDNKEIGHVVDFIKNEAKVEYDPAFLDLNEEPSSDSIEMAAQMGTVNRPKSNGGDDLYEEVKATIMTREYTSISRIQREFGVGFPRAGKIFARLQADGIVASSPETQNNSKGCRVLIHSEEDMDGGSDASSGGENA
nr:hypothetical protein [Bacilli bacterium]